LLNRDFVRYPSAAGLIGTISVNQLYFRYFYSVSTHVSGAGSIAAEDGDLDAPLSLLDVGRRKAGGRSGVAGRLLAEGGRGMKLRKGMRSWSGGAGKASNGAHKSRCIGLIFRHPLNDLIALPI